MVRFYGRFLAHSGMNVRFVSDQMALKIISIQRTQKYLHFYPVSLSRTSAASNCAKNDPIRCTKNVIQYKAVFRHFDATYRPVFRQTLFQLS
jgi:hypothetical protein